MLKLTGEPLTVEALAVTTNVLNAVRSMLQVGVFLAGLLLLGWQLRRAAPRSLPVTIALAMIVGSVGHLLVTTRLLGMVLAIGAPVIVIASAVLLARRYWSRRAEAPGSEAEGTAPTPSPGGSTGMGPAVAAIALMLSVASVQAEEATALSASSDPHSALESVSILSASYTGTVHERVARIDAVVQVSATKAGQTIPLFGEDVAVEEFSATPGNVRLVRQGNSIGVRLPKSGGATLRVKFLVKLGGDVTKRHLAFAIPPALCRRGISDRGLLSQRRLATTNPCRSHHRRRRTRRVAVDTAREARRGNCRHRVLSECVAGQFHRRGDESPLAA